MKTDDWKEVHATLAGDCPSNSRQWNEALDAAISLCQRMARGELVERSELHRGLYTAANGKQYPLPNPAVLAALDAALPYSGPVLTTDPEQREHAHRWKVNPERNSEIICMVPGCDAWRDRND